MLCATLCSPHCGAESQCDRKLSSVLTSPAVYFGQLLSGEEMLYVCLTCRCGTAGLTVRQRAASCPCDARRSELVSQQEQGLEEARTYAYTSTEGILRLG
eukprot:5031417-Amphidinium_carterae.1